MRKINEIIVHCTATPEGRNVTVAEVDKWHRARGFNGIGYHYLIGLDGTVLKGRDIELVGAHCLNHNANSIGVCYVGGLALDGKTAKDTRTIAQRNALKSLLKDLKTKYPGATIHGHREYANKACPCFDAKNEYKDL
ncbi:MAG: N-acetylmuramoyl-L-alanine amidase [Candidatus Symbiothrix sp.]|jgi:N-acetylmuramoyl-L-alanine amidase|nr:N-acetylmuramoyl-L-alanine amidase [Candidatus Symbiothrix sp.]